MNDHEPQPQEPEIPLFSKESLERAEKERVDDAHFLLPDRAAWPTFRKVVPTAAIRMEGPFRVETSESESEPFFCEDGWLAIDARGYPYAIADEEFRKIYEPVIPNG